MSDEAPSKPKFFFFRQRGELGYLAEVSLIIFSILFAFWVERWREGMEEDERLRQYITEIKVDLETELETSKMNSYDCRRDNELLDEILTMVENQQIDSAIQYRTKFLGVFFRGVYRTFAPTTIDVMTNNGDLELIKNNELQKALVSTFAFRNEVAKEYREFDWVTEESGKVLFKDLHLSNWNKYHPIASDLFQSTNTRAVFALSRSAGKKAFTLKNYIEDLEAAKKKLAESGY